MTFSILAAETFEFPNQIVASVEQDTVTRVIVTASYTPGEGPTNEIFAFVKAIEGTE